MDREKIMLIGYIINNMNEIKTKVVCDVITQFIEINDLIIFIDVAVDFSAPNSHAKKRELLSLLEKFKGEWENER